MMNIQRHKFSGCYCMKKSPWWSVVVPSVFSNLLASSCMLSLIFKIATDSQWSCREKNTVNQTIPEITTLNHTRILEDARTDTYSLANKCPFPTNTRRWNRILSDSHQPIRCYTSFPETPLSAFSKSSRLHFRHSDFLENLSYHAGKSH